MPKAGSNHKVSKWRDREKKAEYARKRRADLKEAKAAEKAAAKAAEEAAQVAEAHVGCGYTAKRQSKRPRPTPAPAAPEVRCGDCECSCGSCEQSEQPAPAAAFAAIESLEKQLAALREEKAAAVMKAEATVAKVQATVAKAQATAAKATAALAKRERGPEAMEPERLLAAFATADRTGEPRASDVAVERAAQRAVKRACDALPEDQEQKAVVLDAMLKRPGVREAAAAASIRTAADYEFAEAALLRVKEACAAIMAKRGHLNTDDTNALETLLTFLTGKVDEEVKQRGKHTKRATAEGTDGTAAVHDVRAWAAALGMPPMTAWRLMKAAVERRTKLDQQEQGVLWLWTSKRRGHGLSKETVELVHQFYLTHPSIKRSPIANDVLKLKDANGDVQLVAKLLSEVSLTDVYLEFMEQHPGIKIKERSFRHLAPPELRRMKTRHLDMCGCRRAATARTHTIRTHTRAQCPCEPGLTARNAADRWCVEMRLAQDALNAARARLAQQHGAAYAPPAVHPKPSFAVAAALCPIAHGTGFAPMRYATLTRMSKAIVYPDTRLYIYTSTRRGC